MNSQLMNYHEQRRHNKAQLAAIEAVPITHRMYHWQEQQRLAEEGRKIENTWASPKLFHATLDRFLMKEDAERALAAAQQEHSLAAAERYRATEALKRATEERKQAETIAAQTAAMIEKAATALSEQPELARTVFAIEPEPVADIVITKRAPFSWVGYAVPVLAILSIAAFFAWRLP